MSFSKIGQDGKSLRKGIVLDCQKAIKDGERVLVEQSHKEEVDINKIVSKHAGNMELIAQVASLQNWTYDDVVGNDFQESMNAIIKARDTFDQVPSQIRKQFDNDPAKFMDFVTNPDNQEQLYDWGLAQREPIPEPVQVVVTNPETPPQE